MGFIGMSIEGTSAVTEKEGFLKQITELLAQANPLLLLLAGMVVAICLGTVVWLVWCLVRHKIEKGLSMKESLSMEKNPFMKENQSTGGRNEIATSEMQVEGNPGRTQIEIGKLHEQGERSGQQDCFGVSDESLIGTRGLLAVVADGMGGLADGDQVSAVAVETVLDGFTLYQGKGTPEQELVMLMKQAVDNVNAFLGADHLQKSGTTLLLGLVREGFFSFLSVGDSRICLYRQGNLMQLNREHIYKNKLVLNAINGEIPLQDAYTDSRGNGLVSFVGMGKLEFIDIPAAPVKLVPGDKILLMSDGVYNALEETELLQALTANPEEATERLRQAIQEKAYTNQDNYTAVIIGYGLPKMEEETNTQLEQENIP